MFTARQSEGLWAFVWPGAGGGPGGCGLACAQGRALLSVRGRLQQHARKARCRGRGPAGWGGGGCPSPTQGPAPHSDPGERRGHGPRVFVTSRESSPGAAELSQLFHSSANSFIMDLRGFRESEGCRAVVSGRNAS